MRAKQPLLYRVHDVPLPEKLAALRETLSLRGLTLGGGERPSPPKDYALLIEQTRERIDAPALHTVLLRSLPQAIYTPHNAGHFGWPTTTTRTSRRRSAVTRICWCTVVSKPCWQAKSTRTKTGEQLGDMCSANERRADIASREVTQFLKSKYLEAHLGEEFNGTSPAWCRSGLSSRWTKPSPMA